MAQQFYDVAVAPLADPQQGGLATRRVLAWHQPEPGRQISGASELSPISKCGKYSRCGQRADSGDRHEPSCLVFAIRQCLDLALH